MYNYNLINNHYIVKIDGRKYLIDTGSPVSFWVSEPATKIAIDGVDYHLHNKPSNLNVEETKDVVGVKVDGFIGMDIISKTGLTIYKNGNIRFGVDAVDGVIEIQMTTGWPLMVSMGCNMMSGKFIIDTGAKYAYGVGGLFYNQEPYSHVKDYNPSLGRLDSDVYELGIVVGGCTKKIDVCNNKAVASTLMHMGALMIGSVSSLFEEICVLDTKRGRLILK